MTPPIFNLDDEVIITGKPVTLDTDEFLGKRFTIDTIGKRHGETVFSDAHLPWYPASSLQLVDDVLKIGDEVEIIGQNVHNNSLRLGQKFTIEQIIIDNKYGTMYSAPGQLGFPASSLRLVPSFAKGEKVKVSLGGYLYNGYEFEIERVRDGCVEDSQGRRFRFGILLKTEEELKIGDYAEVQVNGCGVKKGTIIKISKIVEERIPGDKGPYYTADKMPLWPKHELRKLTPEEIKQHMAPKSITPKPDWDEMMIRRVVCMESRLDEIGQSHAELMGDVEALAEKVGAIEKQLADQQDETSDVEEDLDQIFKRLARLEAYQKGEMPEVCDEAICPKDNIRIVIKRGENKTYSTNSRCPETILEFAAMVLDSMKEA